MAPPTIHRGVVSALAKEISPDISVPGRLELGNIQCRGHAELEDDWKLDVVKSLLHHPCECFRGINLIVKYEIHVDQVTDEADQFYQKFEQGGGTQLFVKHPPRPAWPP